MDWSRSCGLGFISGLIANWFSENYLGLFPDNLKYKEYLCLHLDNQKSCILYGIAACNMICLSPIPFSNKGKITLIAAKGAREIQYETCDPLDFVCKLLSTGLPIAFAAGCSNIVHSCLKIFSYQDCIQHGLFSACILQAVVPFCTTTEKLHLEMPPNSQLALITEDGPLKITTLVEQFPTNSMGF